MQLDDNSTQNSLCNTVICIKHTPVKLNFVYWDLMANINSATRINYSPNRFPFIISKDFAKNHIPADIQLSSWMSAELNVCWNVVFRKIFIYCYRMTAKELTYLTCWPHWRPPYTVKDHRPWCKSRLLLSPSHCQAGLSPTDSRLPAHCISQQTHMHDPGYWYCQSTPVNHRHQHSAYLLSAWWLGGVVVRSRPSDSEVAGSSSTRTATLNNNLKPVIYTCGAQADSAFHPSGVGKWVAISIW